MPDTKTEPLVVYYDKKLGDYKEVYFFQDMKGNIIIPIEYEFISPVNYGGGFVICDGKKFPLDKGKVIE